MEQCREGIAEGVGTAAAAVADSHPKAGTGMAAVAAWSGLEKEAAEEPTAEAADMPVAAGADRAAAAAASAAEEHLDTCRTVTAASSHCYRCCRVAVGPVAGSVGAAVAAAGTAEAEAAKAVVGTAAEIRKGHGSPEVVEDGMVAGGCLPSVVVFRCCQCPRGHRDRTFEWAAAPLDAIGLAVVVVPGRAAAVGVVAVAGTDIAAVVVGGTGSHCYRGSAVGTVADPVGAVAAHSCTAAAVRTTF